jgi:hypothetical protein
MREEGEEVVISHSENSSKLEFLTSPFPVNVQVGSNNVMEFLLFLRSELANKDSCFNTDNFYFIEY